MADTIGVPPGFRDVLFDEARARRAIERALVDFFDAQGFRELRPSSVEFYDLYKRGNQHIREDAIRFLDRDDELLALRADFTPAVARIVAAHYAGVGGPMRVWYSGPVFRKTDPRQGTYKETWHIGVEVMGEGSVASDAAVARLALEGLQRAGMQDVQMHVNHAGIFRGVVESLALPAGALRQVQSQINRKDARGLEARLHSLGVDPEAQHQLRELSRCVGGVEILSRAATIVGPGPAAADVTRLREFASHLADLQNTIVFDLTEIDEMEYYTGIMFRFFSRDANLELGGGGRYDTLLEDFGAAMPAVGFSLHMDHLVECR